jgi:hypothetical protein
VPSKVAVEGEGTHGTYARRCAQCKGTPDGTERPHTINGATVWLHDQCKKFYRPEGWSFGFGFGSGKVSPLSFMGSSL